MFFFRKKDNKEQDQLGSGSHERRRFARHNIPCKIFVYSPDDKILSAYTEDMSEEGLQVIVDEQLPLNAVVRIELYVEDEPIICEGRVVWTKECPEKISADGSKMYRTGMEIKSRFVF
ncbi:MAG TPA: PilZ domain-containing protein [Candidatus Omnitrophota bacterium]|nr:PilZ domain-containing protein [Candidatus Omnitrophota bacterium]HPS19686.1 PilZ domain-containing protein [Candidatus Omnitrophota bacterium]